MLVSSVDRESRASGQRTLTLTGRTTLFEEPWADFVSKLRRLYQFWHL